MAGGAAEGTGHSGTVSVTSVAADGRHTVRRNHLDVERQRQTPRRHVVNLIRQTLAAATILFLQEGIVHARFRIQKVANEPSRRLRERHDHRPARELP